MPSAETNEPERLLDLAEAPVAPDECRAVGFPIVGIGASAGGLEAVSQLFAALPEHSGMAFVLVQHLDPTRESRLVELLAKTTRLAVVEATNGLEIESDHVYIIPPNTSLTIAGDVLQIEPRSEARGPHLPIDHFFKSLAEDQQAGAIGVILSGTGSDGTLGVQEIKAAGGFTFAQDADSAKYPTMPLNAVRSGCIDLVLPPEQIAQRAGADRPAPARGPANRRAPVERSPAEEDQFRKILDILRTTVGVDFAAYRDSTVRRRIMRRVVLRSQEGLAQYAEHLQSDPDEVKALYHDILDQRHQLLPRPGVLRGAQAAWSSRRSSRRGDRTHRSGSGSPAARPARRRIRWPSRSLEFLEDKPSRPPIQIFATDLSDAVSLRARPGGPLPQEHRGRSSLRSGSAASSPGRTTITGSARRSGTCASSPGRTWRPTRRSRTWT